MPSLKNMYLVAYNGACAAGWGYVLLSCIKHIVDRSEPQALYNEVEQVLQIVQTGALMEVCCRVFCAVGVVVMCIARANV